MRIAFLFATLCLAISQPAMAETLTGVPIVIDGDTIDIANKRIRLFGIDAPEKRQPASRAKAIGLADRWQHRN